MIRVAIYWIGVGLIGAGLYLVDGLLEELERGADELG